MSIDKQGDTMRAVLPKIMIYLLIVGVTSAALLAGAAAMLPGTWSDKPIFIGAAAVGMVFVLTHGISDRKRLSRGLFARGKKQSPEKAALQGRKAAPAAAARKPIDPNDMYALVEQMLAQDRYALLLRPQIAGNLSQAQFGLALKVLGEGMALVPDGDVELEEGDSSRLITVQRFFLDRYPVTNRQYYEFVAAGGYQQASLWDEAVLPGVLEFVERDGKPGPKFWQDGCYPEGEEKHPVVGISWYEAAAYARWVGKRLPSDAEWVKAGSWPVRISSTSQVQRKYPWGDAMDRTCANLWGSGPGGTVPVDQYPNGVSAGGVYQLIGNVWQWTTSNYGGGSLPADQLPVSGLRLPVALRSIRGGAFDTYFDKQASCQFQSGENPLNRRNNIGFRCAIGVCDLTLVQPRAEAVGVKTTD
jgi:formylglycine-generating enzyme required for sulfatase activity